MAYHFHVFVPLAVLHNVHILPSAWLALVAGMVLVTLGAFVAGHVAVRWAARKADRDEIVPSLAIGFGIIALGLALNESGTLAFAVELGSLALLVMGLLMMARRRLRRAP